MIPKFSEPSAAEIEWIRQCLERAAELASSHGTAAGARLTPKVLDATFAAWRTSAGDEDPNPAIHAIGVGFGQYLVDNLGFRWVIAMDGESTDLGVHRDDGGVLLYPANLVAKRVAVGQEGFLSGITVEIAALASGRLPAGAASTPPAPSTGRRWWEFWKG